MNIAISLIVSYLIGSFPTGKLLAKVYGVDITKSGSGNVGATNVARTLGKKAGIIVLLIDILKGIIAVKLSTIFINQPLDNFAELSGLAAICGHCFSIPPWLKGGKGVATALGVLVSLNPLIALGAVATFAGAFWSTRIVSISSILAAAIAPLLSLILGGPTLAVIFYLLMSLIIIWRHRENVTRLIRGEEKKFSTKS